MQLVWFGGEPLLAMSVIAHLSTELMKICKSANRSYTSNITTNAYLLSYDVFSELLSYNVLNYHITIDGLKHSHDEQRSLMGNQPSYDKIIGNLLYIKEKCKSGKFSINLRTNFTRSMIPDIPKYFDWYNKTFADDKRFKLLIRMASDYGGERVSNVKSELIGANGNNDSFFNSIINSDVEKCTLANLFFYRCGGTICIASQLNTIVIDTDGNIRKCTCRLCDNKHNNFGNILELRGMEQYNSNLLHWSALQITDKCNECFFLQFA